jgi:hypothetical protein
MTDPTLNGQDVGRGDGAKLLDEAGELLARYVSWPSRHACVAFVLWCAATHVQSRAGFASRCVLKSPVPRCGKTRAMEVAELLCRHPLPTVNISVAALVHSITEEDPPAIFMDETDAVWGKKVKDSETSETKRGIINAGFSRGKPYIRWDVTTRETDECPTFAMVMLAAQGITLPGTIEDRAVIIAMQRKPPGVSVAKFRQRRDGPAVEAARDRISAWLRPLARQLGDAEPEMPPGLSDRAEDVWEPLLAVADAAGGHWPALARDAAVALSGGNGNEAAALSLRLLADVRTVFADNDKLHSHVIVNRLAALEEAPWGTWRGHDFNQNDLAGLLKPYELQSRQVKIGEVNRKGYHKADFHSAWSRYLDEEGQTAGEDG